MRLLWLFLGVPFVLAAQHSAVVTGSVVDAVTRERLPQVNITIPGTQLGTASAVNGTFLFAVPAGPCTVQFRLLGYKTLVMTVQTRQGDTARITARMAPDALLLDETVVSAAPRHISTLHGIGATAISVNETKTIAGPMGDVGKIVQALPGVTSNNELSSRYSVRGGSADQNLLMLNGVRMSEPFHLKELPSTSVAVPDVEMMKRLIFIPGGFTAQYGDRLSSVLSMEFREGNPDRFAGAASLSLSDASVRVEGPLSPAARGIASVRTTYGHYVSNYLTGDDRNPAFYDVQLSGGYDPDTLTHVSAALIHSADRTSGIADGTYGFSLVSLHGTRTVSSSAIVELFLSLYNEDEDLLRTGRNSSVVYNSKFASGSMLRQRQAGAHLSMQAAPWYTLKTGVEYTGSGVMIMQHENFQITDSRTGVRDSLVNRGFSPVSVKADAFAENLFQVSSRMLINAGLRLDYWDLTEERTVSPRLLAAYRFENGASLKAAWGLYYQTPVAGELLAAVSAGKSPQSSQKAIHYVLGYEKPLRQDLTMKIEGYYKSLSNLILFQRLKNGTVLYAPDNDAVGEIFGLDFETAFIDERVMGWMNISMLNAKQKNLRDGRGWRPMPTQQRFTINFIFEIPITALLRANLRAFYGSGYSYGDNSPGGLYGAFYDFYPEYKRLDARISYLLNMDRVSSTLYLEVTNLYSYRNVYSFESYDEPETKHNLLPGMIINLGAAVKF